jgi:CTP synthase (UTP-ammonia lyase)
VKSDDRSSSRIAILGDFNPIYKTHHALNESIFQVNKYLGTFVPCDWISTDVFDTNVVFGKGLYSSLWIAPGSPYKDFNNVLDVIRYVRVNKIPTLGNCGGFQHMVIEFARNVCDIAHADHEETSDNAQDLVIHKLACSLAGLEENLTITDKQSIIYSILKNDDFAARYFCSYGLNEKYVDVLQKHGLTFTSRSDEGAIRSFELKSHPFFVGTLFQPALVSSEHEPNPILVEFFKRVSEF